MSDGVYSVKSAVFGFVDEVSAFGVNFCVMSGARWTKEWAEHIANELNRRYNIPNSHLNSPFSVVPAK